MDNEEARRNGIGAKGANKSKKPPDTIGEKSEPISGGGLLRYLFLVWKHTRNILANYQLLVNSLI